MFSVFVTQPMLLILTDLWAVVLWLTDTGVFIGDV